MTRTDDLALGQRLRRDLATLAGTVTEDLPAPARRRPSRRRRLAIGAGVLAVPVALAAGAVVRHGPEYVDTIAPERIITSGSVDGSRWLLVESDRTDECGEPVTGVELVEERKNLVGSEWSTTGYSYGDETDCLGHDPSAWLRDPARFGDSGAQVGDSFVWVYAVHPTVTAVRVEADGRTTEVAVHDVDGAGYAAYEVPAGVTSWRSELVTDGGVVPGSEETQRVRR